MEREPQQRPISCAKGNLATQMCQNDKCIQSNPFECLTPSCQCRLNHRMCTMGHLDIALSMIDAKILPTDQLNTNIVKMIGEKIHQLTELKPFLLKQMEERFQYTQFHQLERKFLAMKRGNIQIGQNFKFTSLESKKIWKSASVFQTINKYNISNRLNTSLQSFSKALTRSIDLLKTNIEDILSIQQHYLKVIPQSIISKQPDSLDTFLSLKMTRESKICDTEQVSSLMIKMFAKRVQKLQRIFRASENEFSIGKFYETCGAKTDTIVVCKTNENKIIGAYTPLVFDQENSDNWVQDTSSESFIFSLTDSERFILKDSSCAIKRSKQKQYIMFGNDEFTIGDKSNTQGNNRSRVNVNYYCPAYSVDDIAAYKMFNGNEDVKFTTQEWEVWKVEFRQEPKVVVQIVQVPVENVQPRVETVVPHVEVIQPPTSQNPQPIIAQNPQPPVQNLQAPVQNPQA